MKSKDELKNYLCGVYEKLGEVDPGCADGVLCDQTLEFILQYVLQLFDAAKGVVGR